MCKVYNTVGSLKAIKQHLQQHRITDFNSLNDVLKFQKTYQDLKRQILSTHEQQLENEKAALAAEISALAEAIKTEKVSCEARLLAEIEVLEQRIIRMSTPADSNFIKRFVNYFKQRQCKKKLRDLEVNFYNNVNNAVSELVGQHQAKSNRHQYLNLHFANALADSSKQAVSELEFKQRVINEAENLIYGALGEHLVAKEMEALTDDHILINDFSLRFEPAIYNRMENDYIKSIQVDHLLVSPAGIFLVETKNWSEKSLARLDLRSPVQQVKRTSFAVFKLLAENISNKNAKLSPHHWGDKKVPIRNLIVLINSKPNEEFQHVKILTLKDMLGYINYFKPIFTGAETQEIANYLLNLNKEGGL